MLSPKVTLSLSQKTGLAPTPSGWKTFRTGASLDNSGGAIKSLPGMAMMTRSLWLALKKKPKPRLHLPAIRVNSIVILMYLIPGLALHSCPLVRWVGLKKRPH